MVGSTAVQLIFLVRHSAGCDCVSYDMILWLEGIPCRVWFLYREHLADSTGLYVDSG